MSKKLIYSFRLVVDMDARLHHVEREEFVLMKETDAELFLLGLKNPEEKTVIKSDNVFDAEETCDLSKYIKKCTRESFCYDKKLDITFMIRAITEAKSYKYQDFAMAICKTEIWLCRKESKPSKTK